MFQCLVFVFIGNRYTIYTVYLHYLYSYSFYTRGWEEGDEMNRVSSYQSEVRLNRIMTIKIIIII